MATSIDIRIPGAVWYDALDPLATAMQGELGLPAPEWKKVGRGSQARYAGVSLDVAEELADYLIDRAAMLLRQDCDPSDKGALYSAIKAGDKIRGQVRFAKVNERTGFRA